MAASNWILPRADTACGRAFHADRQTAESHRIALEFWDRATGRGIEGGRLVSYHCKRCGGYHLARKKYREEAQVTHLDESCGSLVLEIARQD